MLTDAQKMLEVAVQCSRGLLLGWNSHAFIGSVIASIVKVFIAKRNWQEAENFLDPIWVILKKFPRTKQNYEYSSMIFDVLGEIWTRNFSNTIQEYEHLSFTALTVII
jgi:hypothetical protein